MKAWINTKIPRRAMEEAKLRLVRAGLANDPKLERVARIILTDPVALLESFGCEIVWPRKIKSVRGG